jgi:ferredoxin
MIRVIVDFDLCQGHGMCELEAPDVFAAQRDTVELLDNPVDDFLRPDLERAVRFCPTQALSIVQEDD